LLLITTVLTSFFIQRYHVQYIPPSGAAMILGMACGGIAKAAGECFFCWQKRQCMSQQSNNMLHVMMQ